MHLFTHIRPSMQGQSGMPGNAYADGMLEHDQDVGEAAEDAGRPGDQRQHDRGVHHGRRPEPVLLAGCGDDAFPEREGHRLGRWRSGCRRWCAWPGHIKPGTTLRGIFSALDWFPTLLAAAGDATVKQRAAARRQLQRQHVQGSPRRLQPAAVAHGPGRLERAESIFAYFNDDAELVSYRYGPWKADVQGAGVCRWIRGVVPAIRDVPDAEAVQPAHGSV